MSKNLKPRIRQSLPANQERWRNPSGAEAFGIFRPVNEEYVTRLGPFALEVADSMSNVLSRNRESYGEIAPRADFGVTLAPLRNVRVEISRAFRSGFDLGRFAHTMAETDVMDNMYLGIKDVRWARMGPHKEPRYLHFTFEKDEELDRLEEQMAFVQLALKKSGIHNSTLQPKDIHATVLRYGRVNDGYAISRHEAKAISELAEAKMERMQIFGLSLGALIVGNGYRTNHKEVQKVFDSYVHEL